VISHDVAPGRFQRGQGPGFASGRGLNGFAAGLNGLWRGVSELMSALKTYCKRTTFVAYGLFVKVAGSTRPKLPWGNVERSHLLGVGL
jgi:hypothetical protein